MATIRKTLAHRLSHLATVRPSPATASPATSPSLLQRRLLVPSAEPCPIRRFPFLQKRPFYHPAAIGASAGAKNAGAMAFPTGDRLVDRIRELSPTRLNLDGLVPPRPEPEASPAPEKGISAAEVRKVLRASRMEAVRARLSAAPASCASYDEFLRICDGDASIARSLDESGAVIVLGDVVFLRPQEVAKVIQNMIPVSPTHQHHHHQELHTEELRKMEDEKAEIDRKAEALVKRELGVGLGYFVVQTAAFMRLTFWELSWDVMEPICFYVTSIYFMACYAFFLRTSKEPSFEGFFESRFAAKQRRLMKAKNFDIDRYMKLRRSIQQPSQSPSPCHEFTSPSHCNCCSKGSLIGSLH